MSDDGYYYDEYDEFDEMLYDADAEPDLADDLAAHATYSPIWQDDPSEDLRDYFSDWEYYSDDYFDDDPKLIRDVEVVKSGSKAAARQPKRGKKRKLSDAREETGRKREEVTALTACLQGTVWKRKSPEPSTPFKLGVEKPVALRLSKDIMKAAYNKNRGFGKGRLKRDESWANDLSLADMGLSTAQGTGTREQNAGAAQEEDQDEDEEYADEDRDDVEGAVGVEGMLDEDAVDAEIMATGAVRLEIQPESQSFGVIETQAEVDTDDRPRKRRKAGEVRVHVNEHTLPTPDASMDSEDERDVDGLGVSAPQKGKDRSRGIPSKSKALAASVAKIDGPKPQSRKRKLSISESNATGSTASSRAKRMATEQPVEQTAAATRPSRTRKK